MHNSYKKTICRFLAIALIFSGFAFTPSLNEWENEIIRKNSVYHLINSHKKMFVQTDRPHYVAGEEVWLSAFLYDVTGENLNRTEEVMYIDLFNASGERVIQKMFRLFDGRSAGNFRLSSDLPQGKYTLMAYTNWMRNVGSDYFFRKSLFISSDATGQNANSYEQEESQYQNANDFIFQTDTMVSLSFYPEGGAMLTGIPVRVAIESFGLSNKDQTMGLLMDDRAEIILPVMIDPDGTGEFSFVPHAGRSYRTEFTTNDGVRHSFDLPFGHKTGVAMIVQKSPNQSELNIRVVNRNPESPHLPFMLVGFQNGKPKAAFRGDLQQGVNHFILPTADFNTGIAQISIFDNEKSVMAERLMYIDHSKELSFQIKPLEWPEKTRSKALLELTLTDAAGKPVSGDFAISVTDASRISDEVYKSPDINKSLSFISEFPHKPGSTDLQLTNSISKKERYLLNHQDYRHNWGRVLKDSLSMPEFLEEPGIYVQGTVFRNYPDRSAPNVDVNMMVDGSMQIFADDTDDEGRFTFLMRDFEGDLDLLLQTRNQRGRRTNYYIEIASNLSIQTKYNYFKIHNRTTGSQVSQIPGEITASITPLKRGGLVIDPDYIPDELLSFASRDIFLDEVTVISERMISPKERVTNLYGEPEGTLSKNEIDQVAKEKSWHSGLFTFLYDEIPGLFIHTEEASVTFRLDGKRAHRFYIMVDGKFVGASNERGVLSKMFSVYEVNDLISMDPEVIKEVDLIVPPDSFRGTMLSLAAIYMDPLFVDPAMSSQAQMDIIQPHETDLMNLHSAPTAILAIYTINGTGLYTRRDNRGMTRFRIKGFSSVNEFHQPDYFGSDQQGILHDIRNTIAWYPSVKTDESGKVRISFFSSDVSEKYRIEINGITDDGIPVGKTFVME